MRRTLARFLLGGAAVLLLGCSSGGEGKSGSSGGGGATATSSGSGSGGGSGSGSGGGSGSGSGSSSSGAGGGGACDAKPTAAECGTCCEEQHPKADIKVGDYDCACKAGAVCSAACAQTFICGPDQPAVGACLKCIVGAASQGGPCAADAIFKASCLQKAECVALLDCFKTCPAGP